MRERWRQTYGKLLAKALEPCMCGRSLEFTFQQNEIVALLELYMIENDNMPWILWYSLFETKCRFAFSSFFFAYQIFKWAKFCKQHICSYTPWHALIIITVANIWRMQNIYRKMSSWKWTIFENVSMCIFNKITSFHVCMCWLTFIPISICGLDTFLSLLFCGYIFFSPPIEMCFKQTTLTPFHSIYCNICSLYEKKGSE